MAHSTLHITPTFYCYVAVQLFSRVRLLVTPWTAARQASLSFTISLSLLKFMSIESMMLSNHLIVYCPPSPALNLSQHAGSFPVSQLFASGGSSIGASASASVLPVNIQHWFPLGLTGLISLQSMGLSRVHILASIREKINPDSVRSDIIWKNYCQMGKGPVKEMYSARNFYIPFRGRQKPCLLQGEGEKAWKKPVRWKKGWLDEIVDERMFYPEASLFSWVEGGECRLTVRLGLGRSLGFPGGSDGKGVSTV